MTEMIFGVIPNPQADEMEKDKYFRSYWLVVTDKKTWENEERQNDYLNPEAFQLLEEAGFGELMDTTFEAVEEDIPKEEIISIVEGLDFEWNIEFEKFCAERCQ